MIPCERRPPASVVPPFLPILLLAFLATPLAPGATAGSVPEGFVLETAIPDVWFSNPVQVLFLPDGRRLVLELRGTVRTVLPVGEVHEGFFLDLRDEVHANGDLGLLGGALDPGFEQNGWVYLTYTVDPDGDGYDRDEDVFARVVRYRISRKDPNVADPTSRHVVLGASWPEGIPVFGLSHSVGTILFGDDGTLLVGTGDGAHYEQVDAGGLDPKGFGPGRTDPAEDLGAFRARTLSSLSGSVLRIDKETGLGLPSNPFWDGNPKSDRSRIWAYGLRNPFRFTLRPGTGSRDPNDKDPGTLFIADVGWNSYEELDVAREGGRNFGWPCDEGPLPQPEYRRVTSTCHENDAVLCSSKLNPENPQPATPPVLWWHQTDGSLSEPPGWTGSTGIVGPFYTGDAYPESYRGGFFLADFLGDWIRFVRVNERDEIVGWEDFVTEAGGPVHLTIDPQTGYLNYVSLYTRQVKRVRYGAATSVTEEPSGGTPDGPTLRSLTMETAGNPSHAGTELMLRARSPISVTLEVHDALGRRVRRLFDGRVPAGETRVAWDGRDEQGARVAPGVYHAHAVASGMVVVRKLTVVR